VAFKFMFHLMMIFLLKRRVHTLHCFSTGIHIAIYEDERNRSKKEENASRKFIELGFYNAKWS